MSVSEARRLIQLAYDLPDNEIGFNSEYVLQKVIAFGFGAVIEAIAENKPYDGTLNTIRVPVSLLRQISVDLTRLDQEDVGLEDLLISIKAQVNKNPLDKT